MNKNLIYIPIKHLTEKEWLELRTNYIGGSDLGTILGLTPTYKSRLELYLEKIGEKTPDLDNEASFWGKYLEQKVTNIWKYYDPQNPDGYMDNFKTKTKIRNCHKVNFMLVNKKFPHLAGNLDNLINKTSQRGEGILDAKTIENWVASKYIGGMPPSYYYQLMAYLAITELNFGEIAILKNGRYLTVIPFERDQDAIEVVVSRSKEFWDRVQKGKALKEELKKANVSGDINYVNKIKAAIQHNEPDPEGTEAYLNFVNARYKTNGQTIMANETHEYLYVLGKECQEASERERVAKDDKKQPQAIIKNFMGEFTEINFGQRGKITWLANENGTRQLYIKLK